MMKDYYRLSMRALQLAGMSERTQQCYTRSVRMLVDFCGKTPDLISEQELQDYFLHRKNVNKWSAATMPRWQRPGRSRVTGPPQSTAPSG